MSAHADFDAMHVDLFDAFGHAGIVARGGPVTPVIVIVDEGVEQVGEYGRTIGRVTVVSFQTAQWRPLRGDMLTVSDDLGVVMWTKQVESIDADDGFVVKAVMNG